MRKHPVAQMVVVGTIASVIGVALALAIDWFPTNAAAQADRVDTLFDVLLIVSVPVFVLVTTVVLFSVRLFRMRPGQEQQDGPPIHGNTRLEVLWTAVPAILLVGLCSYAYSILRDNERAQADELVVDVSSRQFAWRFAYPQAEGRPASSTELVLPRDRPVRFRVSTEDVIHSFWVPAFRVKIDAVPGITTEVRATPTRLGRYPVVCAELCGFGHAVMRSSARVVTPAAFDRWLARQAEGGAAPGGGGGAGDARFADARATFVANCGSCHTLAAAGTSGTIGPNLTTALAGRPEAEIRTDIVDPSARVADGFPDGVMPTDFEERLSAQQLDDLVAYLSSVSR